jgi:hypothetical protein
MSQQQQHSSGLAAKIEARHTEKIMQFQQSVKELSAALDMEQMQVLIHLRTTLAESREEGDRLLRQEKEAQESHRELLAVNWQTFQSRQGDEEVTVLVDAFHQDGVQSQATRDDAVLVKRREILQCNVHLYERHCARMKTIEECSAALQVVEARRRNELARLVRELLHQLSVVAHTDITASHVLVQRAIASVNLQLVDNQRTIRTLISNLLQHELLSHRQVAETVTALFRDWLQVAAQSFTQWSVELLSSASFKAPKSRTAMLQRIGRSLHKTKAEVTHAMEGIYAVVDTLRSRRNPSALLETCGGTESNGWLRSFDDDMFHNVFAQDPHLVADEWKVFLEVILHNAQCSVVTLTEDTQLIEEQLLAAARELSDSLMSSLELLFTPTTEEIDLVRSASLHPSETVFPFDSLVIADRKAMDAACSNARDLLQLPLLEAEAESQWFCARVGESLSHQKQLLDALLLSASGNVAKTFSDSTSLLQQSTEKPLGFVRTFYVQQFEAMKDYEDKLSWLERDFAASTLKLQHAGSPEVAKQLCIEGMKILEDIEKLYVRYHKQRTQPMPTSTAEAETILSTQEKLICDQLGVTPKVEDGSESVLSDKPSKKEKQSKEKDVQLRSAVAASAEIRTSSGSIYLVTGPLKLGVIDDTPLPAAPMSGEAAIPTPREAAGGKKPPAKGSAKAPSPKPVASTPNADAVVQEQTPLQRVQDSEAMRRFVQRNKMLFEETFYDDCMFPAHIPEELTQRLRTAILLWLESLKLHTMESIRTYCGEKKKELDKQMNEAVRRHQRRAPTLQAQVYEARTRELSDGAAARAKYFDWLKGRVQSLATTVDIQREQSNARFQQEVQVITTFGGAVSTINSISALDSHGRAFGEKIRLASQSVDQQQAEVTKLISTMEAAIRQECTTYQRDKIKTFEDGGDMSLDEANAARELLTNVENLLTTTVAQSNKQIADSSLENKTQLETLKSKYESTKGQNVGELQFFTKLQEVVAQMKGRVSSQISQSLVASGKIEDAIRALDEIAVVTINKADDRWVTALLSQSLDTHRAELIQKYSDIEVPSDSWEGADEALSHRLIAAAHDNAKRFDQSIAAKLFRLMDELRSLLLTRGWYLNGLSYGTEFLEVFQSNFFEPRKESNVNTTAGWSATSPAAADKKGKKPTAPAAKASSAAPQTDNSAVEGGTMGSGPRMPTKAEAEVQRWSTEYREAASKIVHAYFQEHPNCVISRPLLFGSSADEILATIHSRFHDEENRSAAHVVEALGHFREQVHRIFVLLHNCPSVVFACVYQLSVEGLQQRLSAAYAVFAKYYCTMAVRRYENSASVKGSLALPANRSALEALALAETQRQEASKNLTQKFWYIFNRELQEESARCVGRVQHVLFTFFSLIRGVVTPEHVIPGEEVVAGQHKGLRRLMKQKMRADALKTIQDPPAGADAAKAKKEPPKKEPAKPKGKGGKGDSKEEGGENALAPLPRTLTEYPTFTVRAFRALHQFKQDYPNVTAPNHYVPPSQWSSASEAAAADPMPPTQSEKKPQPPPKPAAKPAKGAAANTALQPSNVQAIEDTIIPPTSAPSDRLHQQSVLLRQNATTNFAVMCDNAANVAGGFFRSLLSSDTEWSKSWESALTNLRTESIKK